MTYVIRKTDLLDIDQLIEVEKSATQAFLSIPDLSWLVEAPVLSKETHIELIENMYGFSIVNEHNQVVGFLYAKKQDYDFYIIEFDVRSDLQKQGIGRQLLEYAIDVAKQEGYKAVTLTTFVDVAWNRPFYEKLGFEITNEPNLPTYLNKALANEIAFGFKGETRCAMRLALLT